VKKFIEIFGGLKTSLKFYTSNQVAFMAAKSEKGKGTPKEVCLKDCRRIHRKNFVQIQKNGRRRRW
jgi:hypothetical protein